MDDQKHMLLLAERLRDRLTPERNRQPALECETWLIHLNLGSDRLCAGVAVRNGCCIESRFVSEEALARLDGLLLPVARANIRLLLEAARQRLARGHAEPPPGISYDAPKMARGDSVLEILDMVWQFGPGLLQDRKPAPEGP